MLVVSHLNFFAQLVIRPPTAEKVKCFAVMRNISDNDFNSWINEWTKVADKVKNDANKYLEHGDKVSALKRIHSRK